MKRLTLTSPIGPLTITAEDGAITALDFGADETDQMDAVRSEPVLREAKRQLDQYFAGERAAFDLPLRPEGSAFRCAVWQALSAIPFGQTRTYGDIARVVGSAPRAIGGACGANPIPIVVPCHRVVGANGHLVGFSGGAGCATKRQLLEHEAAQRSLAL